MSLQDVERLIALQLYRVVMPLAMIALVGLQTWMLFTVNNMQVAVAALPTAAKVDELQEEVQDVASRQKHAVLSQLGKIQKNMASAADLADQARRIGRLEKEVDDLRMILIAGAGSGGVQQYMVPGNTPQRREE